MMTNS